MLSSFFILSPRGDTIVCRSFRGDGGGGGGGVSEIFFRRVKEGHGRPIVVFDDFCFVYLKRSSLYFVLRTGRVNAPLSIWVDLLESLVRIIKDFCGVLNENSIRKNFALVYEVIDEVFDFGYPQAVHTGELTNVIRNEAVSNFDPASHGYTSAISNSLSQIGSAGLTHLSNLAAGTANFASTRITGSAPQVPRTVPSNASQAPITLNPTTSIPGSPGNLLAAGNGSDIFIDILDRVSAEGAPDGTLRRFQVDGLVLMKSYMTEGVTLRLALNEDLTVNNPFLFAQNGVASNSSVQLDDCLFHEAIDPSDFAHYRALVLVPPQGEFTLMTYRATPTASLRPPFHLLPHINITAKDKVEIIARLKPDNFSRNISGVLTLVCHLPPWIDSGTCEDLTQQRQAHLMEVQPNDNRIIWTTKRLNLMSGEAGFRAKLSLNLGCAPRSVTQALACGAASTDRGGLYLTMPGKSITPEEQLAKYFGPITASFELPMHTCTKLQIRYLRLVNPVHGQEAPRRWVRYATQSASYTARFT